MTDEQVVIGVAVDLMCADLDAILNRVVRPDAILRLERESAKHWLVIDDRNDAIMLRTPDRATAVRFAHAFVGHHSGASMDRSFGLAQGSGEELGAATPPMRERAASPEQFSVSVDHLDVAQVIPIRRGVA